MSIYFGSQTGTAEGYARVLSEEGKDAGFDTKMHDLEEFDANTLKDTRLAIFLMATYGEGEPTDNSARFMRWLKNEDNEVPADFLTALQFTVFGLGNKQYEHFNRMGKLTDAALEKLGALRCAPYGQGDDDGTLEEDFETWKTALWPALRSKFMSSADDSSSVASETSCFHRTSLQFAVQPAARASIADKVDMKHVHNSCKHFFTAPRVPVIASRELRTNSAGATGSTKHIDLDLSACGLKYETADNLAILPENPSHLVLEVARHMGYDLDEVVQLTALAGEEEAFKAVYPSPCSVRDLLTCYLDLQGELKAGTLRALVSYVADPAQRAWLERMLQHDHRAELKSLLRMRDLADLLASELSALQLPLVDLLHVFPPIQPRYYTISSSALAQPTTVSVTVSLTQGNSQSGRVFTGLCSGYLCRLQAQAAAVRVFVRASTFRLPKSISTPLILIGPGTGIAPMHAFLQERRHLLTTRPELRSEAGPIALFFGCRYAEIDYLYKEELQQMVQEGVLPNLYLAFSRDSSASHDGSDEDAPVLAKSKVYVQHLLQLPHIARRMVSWLNQSQSGAGAHVYVCGATNMGHDVMGAMQKILSDAGSADAVAAIKSLHDEGRYVQELWSA